MHTAYHEAPPGRTGQRYVDANTRLTLSTTSLPATSSQVPDGNVYSSKDEGDTPSILNAGQLDFNTALATLRGLPNPDHTDLALGAIAGLTLTPGLYKFNSGVTVRCSCPHGPANL